MLTNQKTILAAAVILSAGNLAAQLTFGDSAGARRQIGADTSLAGEVRVEGRGGTELVPWPMNAKHHYLDGTLRLDAGFLDRPAVEVGMHAFIGDWGFHYRTGVLASGDRGRLGVVRINGETRRSVFESAEGGLPGWAIATRILPGDGAVRNVTVGFVQVTMGTNGSAWGYFHGNVQHGEDAGFGARVALEEARLVASATAESTVLWKSSGLGVALSSELGYGTHELRMDAHNTIGGFVGEGALEWIFGSSRLFERLRVVDGTSRTIVDDRRGVEFGNATFGWDPVGA